MKFKILLLILFCLISQNNHAQNKKVNLSNTYWRKIKSYNHTRVFIPLKIKPDSNSTFDYLIFDKKNNYQFHMYINSKCVVNSSGKFILNKAQIQFDDSTVSVDKECQGFDEFRLDKRSVVLKNNKLYLTQPTKWYDNETIKDGDTIILQKEELGRIELNEAEKFYITDSNKIPFEDGYYKISEENNKIKFRVKNGLLEGFFEIQSSDRKVSYLYQQGNLLSEKRWKGNILTFEKSIFENVKKESGDFIITKTEINKNYIKNYNDSIVTIFKNTKPILKSRYEDNQLITQKNFIDNTFKEYRNNGDIKIIEMPGISIEYDYQGKEKSKELFQKNSYKQFIYGILRKEKKYTDSSITTIIYDENGNIVSSETEKRNNIVEAEIANMDKFEPDLTNEKFEYYKKIFQK